ncbi:MAG: hypothetical protein J1F60_10450 [Oscillospiraceae bacterium]|nr:hypothetical protein [Oscillospiraceae bacterium]
MNSSMEKMIQLASSKLGVSPEKLKSTLESGNVEDMLGSMRREDADKLKKLMKDPSARDKLLKSPEAAKIIKKMQE